MIEKPKHKVFEPCFDYDEVTNYIEKKYKIDLRDLENAHKEWYAEFKDEAGIEVSYTIQYTTQEYKKYKEWKEKKGYKNGEYRDFWHWLTDHWDCNLQGTFQFMPIDYNKINWYSHEPEDWVKKVLDLFIKEFKDDLNEDGYLYVFIEKW